MESWRVFTNIVDFDVKYVEEILSLAMGISYNASGELLHIDGTVAQFTVSVYGTNGALYLQRDMAAGESVSVASLPKGEYNFRVCE